MLGRSTLFLMMLALVCASCGRQARDITLYERTGGQKPIVTVLPVIDHTSGAELSWNLSEEFTEEIRQRIFNSPHVYLLRSTNRTDIAEQFNIPNPLAISPDAREALGAAEFVVVAELLNQGELTHAMKNTTNPPHADTPATFALTARVRVLDVRRETPKVVLQEVVNLEHQIVRPYMHCDYTVNGWGTEMFSKTPMGMAHSRLVKDLVSRVEEYIDTAR